MNEQIFLWDEMDSWHFTALSMRPGGSAPDSIRTNPKYKYGKGYRYCPSHTFKSDDVDDNNNDVGDEQVDLKK